MTQASESVVLTPRPLPDDTSARVVAVIVHHRGREMLDLAVRSLLASESVDLEIVVVSNDCREPLPEIVGIDSRTHVVETGESVGFSEANNRGVRWAEEHLEPADFYYFVNNDTESLPDTLAHLLAALRERPRAAMAGPQTRILGHRDHLNSLGINVTEDAWGWDEGIGLSLEDYGSLPGTRPVLTVTGSALLIERETFERVGGWTELYDWYFEDIDLGIKVWKTGREVLNVADSLIYHQISATMTTDAERKVYFFHRNRLFLAMIHWPWGLLLALLRRAYFHEIMGRAVEETKLHRRAFSATLRRAPKLLLARWRLRGDTSWRRFLHPTGSVPVITLPADHEEVAENEEAQEPGLAPPPEMFSPAVDFAPPTPKGRRILLVGWSPLPFEEARIHYAPSERTWQLARALASEGHAVCVVTTPIPGTRPVDEVETLVETSERDGILLFDVAEACFTRAGLVGLVEAFEPEALVGAAALPSRLAVRLAWDRPVWVDLFGDLMAEAQARADVVEGDILDAYWHLNAELLQRGDAFSVVSERQRWATLGQLGIAGRLGRETTGHEMIHVVPCPAPEIDGRTSRDETDSADDSFEVLWSGSFNTWCDIDTLVDGLEQAMDDNPRIHFSATGGAIEGHDHVTAEHLRDRVESSRHRKRFSLLGRLPRAEAEAVWRRADLGVLTEKPIAERQLGSSGRLAGWLARGLPFVATDLSELGEQAAEAGAAWTYPPGDAKVLARRILEAAGDPKALAEKRRRARRFAEEQLSLEVTTRPLREWSRNPRRAPDAAHSKGRGFLLGEPLKKTLRELDNARERAEIAQLGYHEIRAELGRIHQSRMWKTWTTGSRYLRALLDSGRALFSRRG